MKLIVLDANFFWTERLFMACTGFAEVLLVKPREIRAFYKENKTILGDSCPRMIAPRLWEMRMSCVPGWLFHLWPVTERLFARRLRPFVKSGKTLLVSCYPYYVGLAERLNIPLIYYSIDDYATYWPGRAHETQKLEYEAVRKSAATICVSKYRQNLLKKHAAKPDAVHHLPNGCSPEFMVSKPLDGPLKFPEPLAAHDNIRRPVAGYIGALNDRFDFDFLFEAAKKLPEVSFVLGGDLPCEKDGSKDWWRGVERCRSLLNIHFIGRVAHAQVGRRLQSFDVLLIVYSHNDFNLSSCPTKLWDYLGTSLPIVANDAVPELETCREYLYLSRSPEEFAKKILTALKSGGSNAEQRLALARDHTWERQAQRLQTILEHVV